MRIVVVQSVASFYSHNKGDGGEIYLHKLLEIWKTMGNEIILITNKDDKGFSTYKIYDRIFTLPTIAERGIGSTTLKLFFNWFSQKKGLREIISLLQSIGKYVLITEAPTISDVVNSYKIARASSPYGVYVYFHLVKPFPSFRIIRKINFLAVFLGWVAHRISLVACKLFNFIPVLNYPETLTDLGWKFKVVLRNKVFIQDLRTVENNKRERYLLFFVSRLTKLKGVLDIPKIISIVRNKHDNIRVVIAGEQPDTQILIKLNKLIEKYSLEDIIEIKNYLSPLEKATLFSKSSLFIFPSYQEGWPAVVTEAATLGCVPVTYDMRAYDFLGTLSVRAKYGDTKDFASKVIQLIDDWPKLHDASTKLIELMHSSDFYIDNIAIEQLNFFKRVSRIS
jgi:glycosyltransferase involved in cell wall biosynthesis